MIHGRPGHDGCGRVARRTPARPTRAKAPQALKLRAANAPRARSIGSPPSRAAAPPPPAAAVAVTPEACAAKVSLRLATRSSCRACPQTSSTTAPSASQASASAAVRNAASTSAARTVTSRRGSRPSSHSPLIDSAPDSSLGKILPHPDQRPARRDPPRETCDETGRRGALPSLGEHFMHRGHRKPALQRRIRIRMPERDRAERMRIGMRLDALDAAAQSSQACSCVRRSCAAPPEIVGRFWFRSRTRSWLICS